MDPLSDVLALLKLQNYAFSGFEAGGEWSLQFPMHPSLRCYSLIAGSCWLKLDDSSQALHLKAGDCFLLPRGNAFRLASDLALPSIDALSIFPADPPGGIARCNDGQDVIGVGGYFSLSSKHVDLLLGELPAIVHIRNEAEKTVLRWSFDRLRQELRDPQPGGFLLAQHVAQIILIQALRTHLTQGARGNVGWLFALADPQIRDAITAMHEAPGQRWTLQTLAALVGMSRSSFAQKFKALVGVSPLEYLTRWRMMLAEERLANSSESIATIALLVGYESESAFSTAFKRVLGNSPRQHSRRRIS